MKQTCDAVVEGGGVRGIGLAGAAYAFERAGYGFGRLAGSSAGAIIASLLAAGYGGGELEEIMRHIDYERFKQKDFIDYFGTAGKLLSVGISYGVYGADYFESWLGDLLGKKGVGTFGDLRDKKKLRVTATDVTDKKLLVLPDDLPTLGIDPDKFSIAAAVRMSISIPIFYEPSSLAGLDGCAHYIVDGGLLSNFPVWILDDGVSVPETPVFGFRFTEKDPGGGPLEKKKPCPRMSFPEYLKAVISTALAARDAEYNYNVKDDGARTVDIPITVEVSGKRHRIDATDFDITPAQSAALFNNGIEAGTRFLLSWDFPEWQKARRLSCARINAVG
ncbi:MAG: patatin-like phospholipase family protein [Clostridiales bacterium]|jgi:NTE family protein|nr:patatin-like phospholipase family protein [Clostridiales bacterium]